MVAFEENFFARPRLEPAQVPHGFSRLHGPGNVAGNHNTVLGRNAFIPALRKRGRVVIPPKAGHAFLARRGQVQVSNGKKAHSLLSLAWPWANA